MTQTKPHGEAECEVTQQSFSRGGHQSGALVTEDDAPPPLLGYAADKFDNALL